MSADRDEKRALAVGLMAHSIISTKPHSAEEAEACHARFTRARDFLLHASARPVVTVAGPLTSEQMEESRADALRNLRVICAACGLCRRFGVDPP